VAVDLRVVAARTTISTTRCRTKNSARTCWRGWTAFGWRCLRFVSGAKTWACWCRRCSSAWRQADGALLSRLGTRTLRAAWDRNVRELERAVEAALALSGEVLELESKTPAAPAARPTTTRSEKHERREQLRALLTEHEGNVAAVARAMGKAREQVYRWIKSAGLDPTSSAAADRDRAALPRRRAARH